MHPRGWMLLGSMVTIIDIQKEHYDAIASIYAEGIATGIATFETTVPSWEQWNTSHLQIGRIAAILNNNIVGWAALSPVSSRCVYEGVAEVSVYVSEMAHGKGVASLLILKLIEISETHNIWTLQSGIFPSNEASIGLHRKLGFREIGYREKIAKLHGIWYDNVLFEKRSKTII